MHTGTLTRTAACTLKPQTLSPGLTIHFLNAAAEGKQTDAWVLCCLLVFSIMTLMNKVLT